MPKEIVIKQKTERDVIVYDKRHNIVEIQANGNDILDIIYIEKSSIPALISALTELAKEKEEGK